MAGKNNNDRSAGADTSSRVTGSEPERAGSPVSAIVGIGASAGGLEALEELFRNMPADTGLAFLVVTHLHPGHKSLLPELLAKITEMPVLAGADDLEVEPNHIYVGLPGGQLSIRDGRLRRMDKDQSHSPKMPINFFLRSLAQDQRERAVCIILSGTGSDGTLGLQEIKAQAGLVMVERPQSAKHSGMPASAIATGMADFVLAPAAMPEQLIRYIRAPFLSEAATDMEPHVVAEGPLQEIFALLRRRTGHDFSEYKSNTIHRRIARRMNVHQIESHEQYVRYLRESPDEIDVLFKELLINVTNFFRDPQAWDALRTSLAALVGSRPDGSTLRVWVPGCSSGEEVFSIAILLHECMDAAERQLEVQIFGTDLDSTAIDKARTGLFEEGIADDLTPQRLSTFFYQGEGRLSYPQGYSRHDGVRAAECHQGSTVYPDGPYFLSQPADLPQCEHTKEAFAHVPLRAQAGRAAVSRFVRKHRLFRRAVRATGQALENISPQGGRDRPPVDSGFSYPVTRRRQPRPPPCSCQAARQGGQYPAPD
jgi:two-component system CheB/CheR fusion protein